MLLASEFPTFYERFDCELEFFIVWLSEEYSSELSGIVEFGFSMAHLCFAFFSAASDKCVHISGHTLSGPEIVCFLVSLYLDHVYPSGGLSFNKMNLVKPVSASDNSLSPIHVPVIFNNVSPSIHPRMYESFW